MFCASALAAAIFAFPVVSYVDAPPVIESFLMCDSVGGMVILTGRVGAGGECTIEIGGDGEHTTVSDPITGLFFAIIPSPASGNITAKAIDEDGNESETVTAVVL